jgi:HSP20 family protein
MAEKDILKEKIDERKEKFEEKEEKPKESKKTKEPEEEETTESKEEKTKEPKEEETTESEEKEQKTEEKTVNYSEKFANDLNNTIEEIKENFKSVQKYADEKLNEYKNATVSNLAADLIETDEIYYLKVAIPGISKEDVEIVVGDNDIVITTTFKSLIEELEDIDDAKVIASELTTGKCSKTVRFEKSIDMDNIKAKYNAGIVLITLPKLIIPKHKITVE